MPCGVAFAVNTGTLFWLPILAVVSGRVSCPGVDVEAAAVDVVVVEERGVSGRGHTTSRTFSLQYCPIWLCIYHCLSRERPEGTTTGCRISRVRAHVLLMTRKMFSSSVSDIIFTHTHPGVEALIFKV